MARDATTSLDPLRAAEGHRGGWPKALRFQDRTFGGWPMAPLGPGRYTLERLAGEHPPYSPGGPPRDGPPNLGSIAGRPLPIFTDFSDFLGRLLVIVEFYSH